MELKRVSYKHKNNKPTYYLINYVKQCIPGMYYQKKIKQKINSKEHLSGIQKRVDYYNKLLKSKMIIQTLSKGSLTLSKIKTKRSTSLKMQMHMCSSLKTRKLKR